MLEVLKNDLWFEDNFLFRTETLTNGALQLGTTTTATISNGNKMSFDGEGVTSAAQEDDEINSVLWVGNLDSKVTEAMLYELFLQAWLKFFKLIFDLDVGIVVEKIKLTYNIVHSIGWTNKKHKNSERCRWGWTQGILLHSVCSWRICALHH